MKKVLKYVFLFIMIIPILVKASSFNDAKIISNNYQSKFLTPDRYLISSTDNWGLDGTGKPKSVSGFTKGGLITQREIEITRKKSTNPMSFSYIYDGTKIWTIENKIVSESFISGSDAKIKPTEYVKKGVTVSGIGTKEDPWIFVDSYRVTVKAVAHGKIDGQASSEKPVSAGGSVSFSIDSNSGYIYLDNTCGRDALYDEETEVLTISKVSKDMVCEVRFDETKYNYQFPTPCKKVTTSKYGERNHCFSNAVPRRFYVNYLKGYYQDNNYTKRLGQITKPALTGWVFDRFKVGNTTLVDSNGIFETSYGLFNDSSSDSSIGFEIHEKSYTIQLDFQGGTGGTAYTTALYDHDVNSVSAVPKIPGYVFIGYYSATSGGDKYLNGQGKVDSDCEPWNQDVASPTIYAHYRKCYKGYKCPTGNDETACPVGQHQDTEGQTTCKPCPAGTYTNSIATVTCTNCSPGYHQPSTGQTSCIPCGTGKYQDGYGATSCKPCAAGHYNNSTGQSSCPCCPGGTYQGSTGQTSCNNCSGGYYSTGCAASCTACAAGTYNTGTRNTGCTNCPGGKYQNLTGQTSCKSCSAGSYSTGGAASCTPCAAGHYNTSSEQTSCTACAAGKYQANTGKTSCDTCGSNTYSGSGASSCTNCPSGYSGPSGSGSINNCWRTRYTKYYWTRSKLSSGNKCECEGYRSYSPVFPCSMESCYYIEKHTCTVSGCPCVYVPHTSGDCTPKWSDWSSSSNRYVYGSCSGSGGGDSQDWKYTCSVGTTVYYPN